VIVLGLLVVMLVVSAVSYPFARLIAERRFRQGAPTWWSLRLHGGDREAALEEDTRRHAARRERRSGRWRFPPFLAVPITLGLFFWLLVRAARYANEHGLWVP
jgi:hypothetical protein